MRTKNASAIAMSPDRSSKTPTYIPDTPSDVPDTVVPPLRLNIVLLGSRTPIGFVVSEGCKYPCPPFDEPDCKSRTLCRYRARERIEKQEGIGADEPERQNIGIDEFRYDDEPNDPIEYIFFLVEAHEPQLEKVPDGDL